VDDDEHIRELVVVRLRHEGHTVMAAGSPTEALAIIADRGAPDVAVLDIDMPEMNGLQLLIQLRLAVADDALPAVFLSGHVRDNDIEAGRALGATYLTKPFIATALIAAVERSVRAQEDTGW